MPSEAAGLAASLCLHAVLLAAFGVFAEPAALPQAIEQVVLVELVSAQPPVVGPDNSPGAAPVLALKAPDAGAAAAAGGPAVPAPGGGMIEATVMMAGAALADPRNAEARAMLPMIDDALRREQVCGIEAMEQIRSRDPDFAAECVISYALAAPERSGDRIIASGAVVHAGAQWYRLEYDCTLGADLASVTAFRYRVGDPVSDAERDRLGLAPCH